MKDDLVKTETAFRSLSESLEKAWITEWTQQEENAMSERGTAMEIYDVAISRGNEPPVACLNHVE